MAKKIRAVEGFFGGTNYYDEHGKKIGHSEPGFSAASTTTIPTDIRLATRNGGSSVA